MKQMEASSGDGLTAAQSSPVEQEQAYLSILLQLINRQVGILESTPRYFPEESEEPQTADEVAQQAVDAMRNLRTEQLSAARSEPYFGRIDFAENGDTVQPLYIGKRGIEDESSERLVIDWRAPVASVFYSFTGRGDTVTYDAPDGTIEGTVHLKRNVLIRQSELQRVVNSYVRGQADNLGITDEFLLYRLSEQKDSRLRDIVSTIQAEQDQIIRANRQHAVVIQGVAGSGKTTVALHRVAYLLYQHAERMRADRIVIFAPNAMFVDYISEVLPELGVGGIQQTTFAKWATKMLGNTVKLRDPARRLAEWFGLTQSQAVREKYDAAKFKGSEAFHDLLELQLHRLEQEWLPKGDFEPWDGKILEQAVIQEWFTNDYRQLPPYARRERVLARVKRWYETEYRSIKASDTSGARKRTAASRFRAYGKRWKPVSVLSLYQEAWQQAAQLGLSSKESIGKGRRPEVELEDLAGLMYLHLRLHGHDGIDRFDHVVIDEAQDFSPLQITVLRMCCPSGSFTILGDLAQSIHSYQGISSWDRFLSQFPEEKVAYYQLDVSYRSTMEIIDFANGVLSRFPGFRRAKPVFRSGQPVQVSEVCADDWKSELVNVVQGWQSNHSGAVVCRTDEECKVYYNALVDAGIKVTWIRSDQEQYTGGLSVLPVYLTKGLEFDSVLMVDVDNVRYPVTPDAAKLLYVGCTRALHALSVHYRGNPSVLLSVQTGE